MAQLDIFAPPSTLDTAFWAFHKANPQVYDKLVELSYQAKRAGRRHIGMKMLFEVVRWNHLVHTTTNDFKLNNSYTSRYVRIIEAHEPELVGLFEKRKIKS